MSQFVSRFDHARKRHRLVGKLDWHCVEVFEPGYIKNVSIRRVLSHIVFDLLILFYFFRECFRNGLPDTIVSALPHNGAACMAAFFAKVTRTHFIVDVHDTWPESILGVARLNFLKRIVYHPWKACADIALLAADDVFGESILYAERANRIRHRFNRSSARAIYIGGDLAFYRGIKPINVLPTELRGASFIVSYAGTLGANNDLDCMIEAFASFEKECPVAGLMILGGGEREETIRNRIADLSMKAWVSGRLPYAELLGYLKCSHVGLNCFKVGGNVAYSYKLNDYLLSGLPIINSLEGESADLISAYDLGRNYQAGNTESLLDALRTCYAIFLDNGKSWSEKIVDFSLRTLDRDVNYKPLIDSCLCSGKNG